MNIKIEALPKYRTAYVRQVGPYGPANIQAMDKLKKWAEEKNLIKSAIILRKSTFWRKIFYLQSQTYSRRYSKSVG